MPGVRATGPVGGTCKGGHGRGRAYPRQRGAGQRSGPGGRTRDRETGAADEGGAREWRVRSSGQGTRNGRDSEWARPRRPTAVRLERLRLERLRLERLRLERLRL